MLLDYQIEYIELYVYIWKNYLQNYLQWNIRISDKG